eukprot:CAMPEP_0203926324 /NCGR_PEP_ID=MMETSP0359-20131031/65858_1 /ASSEMBLY_ACC=CAM_ASM_000338 /TAXON_ID=268821 /ORGANISM="Scrippsiella Hangoei, Strain SHTV-5" /LENGTH=45 /DNA_ID= /DNA_START= /DNA_END= /DNA_ORIENTATION=
MARTRIWMRKAAVQRSMHDMQGKRSACRGQHVTRPRDAAAISAGS